MFEYINIVKINEVTIPSEAISEDLIFFPKIRSIMIITKAKEPTIISGDKYSISLKLII